MNEFLIGMFGALVGGLLAAGTLIAISLYEISSKNKIMKDFENKLLAAVKDGKGQSKLAQVLPFKAPTPPKVN